MFHSLFPGAAQLLDGGVPSWGSCLGRRLCCRVVDATLTCSGFTIVPRHVLLLPAFDAGAPHRLRPSRGSRRVPYCTSAGCPFCWCHKSARHRWHISGPDYDPHEQKVLQRYKPVGRTGIRARTAQTTVPGPARFHSISAWSAWGAAPRARLVPAR